MNIEARAETVRIKARDGTGVYREVVFRGSAQLSIEEDGLATLTIPLCVLAIHVLEGGKALVVAQSMGQIEAGEGELQVSLRDVASQRASLEQVQSRLPLRSDHGAVSRLVR